MARKVVSTGEMINVYKILVGIFMRKSEDNIKIVFNEVVLGLLAGLI